MSVTLLETQGPAIAFEAGVLAGSIVDDASFEKAGVFLRTVKDYLAQVAAVFDPIDRAQIESRKVTIAQRKALEQHAISAEAVLKTKMATYQREQEDIRRREYEERQRIARAEEEARRLEEAVKLEQIGDTEAAERVLETPAPVLVAPPPPVVKAEGVSIGETWSAEVDDLMALVMAVASRKQPVTLLLPNTVALNGMARSLKGHMNVPGVRAVSTARVAVRR